MNEIPSISIPDGLLPADGRFGSGPSRIDPDAVQRLADTGTAFLGTSHRRPTVQSLVGRIREGLSSLYALPDGYEVVLGVGGATAFWDVAAMSLIERRSAHFTCGEFSGKFAAVAARAPHLESPVVVDVAPGNAPQPRSIDGVDAAAFIHNETSTGVRADFGRFGGEIVLVDGTSAAGAIHVDPLAFDAYYFSPQKAFGSDGGLWIALVSAAAVDRAQEIEAERPVPVFLSFTTAIDNSRLDQTYNTPALATLWLLAARIDELAERGGLAAAQATAEASSDHCYRWAETSPYASPFVEDPTFRSPTVVTVDIDPSIAASEITRHLRANGIVDIDGYRKLGRNQIRIATFPTIPTTDIEALTSCIDFVVDAIAPDRCTGTMDPCAI